MKLGDKVKFDRELIIRKNSRRWKEEERTRELKHDMPLTGIICGVRTIVSKGILEGGIDESYYLVPTEYKKVYLVATDLRGFHRVPEEWIIENITELEKLSQHLSKQWCLERWWFEALTEEEGAELYKALTGEGEEDET